MFEKELELIEKKDYTQLLSIIRDMNPVDIANLLSELPENKQLPVFRMLPKDIAAEVFVEMETEMQELLIRIFTDAELHSYLEELYVDDAVDIIEEMPANVVRRILRLCDPHTREQINQILRYPKDSAGSIMTTEFVGLRADMTVFEAFARIRKIGIDKETIYTCFVTDSNLHLVGVVTVKEMILAGKDTVIGDIMHKHVVFVKTTDDKEEAAMCFDKYDFMAIPVVDQENRLVGIVTYDDAIDVLQEENTEDIMKMAAITPEDDSYLRTPVWKHAKSRILWLMLLMISSTFTGMILTHYEAAFVSLPVLVSFVPMLMGTGGNCGSQSATMVIRGLALDEIENRDFLKVLFKEFRIALMVGSALAIVNTVRIMLMPEGTLALATVLGISIIATAVLAKSLGCCLPMLARKLKLDPAIMASPLITTIVDACSVLLYFSIAVAILKI